VKPGLKIAAWTVFGATLLIALVVGAFVAWLLSEVTPAGTVITVDGERFVVPAFQHAGHYALAVLGVWVAALAIVMMAPVLIVLGVVVPALLSTLGVALAVLILAVLFWPVYLLVRRVWKRGAKHPTITS
jgi:hypothetical protein